MYGVIKTLSILTCHMPEFMRKALAFFIGRAGWLAVNRKRKRMSIDNVLQCGLAKNRDEAVKIVKESTYRFGPMLVEVMRFPILTEAEIDEKIEFEGMENFWSALGQGKGAVLATAHSGNWELLGASLAYKKIPLVAVVRKQNNPGPDKFINEYRRQAGMHITYNSSIREMVRLLGAGMVIGLLMDQDAGPQGLWIDFFGRKASTPSGSAALARMKGAPIVPTFIVTMPNGRHKVIVHEPIMMEKTNNREHDIIVTTEHLSKIIEEHIRQYPTDWFWLHNRWKNWPEHADKN